MLMDQLFISLDNSLGVWTVCIEGNVLVVVWEVIDCHFEWGHDVAGIWKIKTKHSQAHTQLDLHHMPIKTLVVITTEMLNGHVGCNGAVVGGVEDVDGNIVVVVVMTVVVLAYARRRRANS